MGQHVREARSVSRSQRPLCRSKEKSSRSKAWYLGKTWNFGCPSCLQLQVVMAFLIHCLSVFVWMVVSHSGPYRKCDASLTEKQRNAKCSYSHTSLLCLQQRIQYRKLMAGTKKGALTAEEESVMKSYGDEVTYRLTEERLARLESIGFVWNMRNEGEKGAETGRIARNSYDDQWGETHVR